MVSDETYRAAIEELNAVRRRNAELERSLTLARAQIIAMRARMPRSVPADYEWVGP